MASPMHHLAQLNVARMVAPLYSPEMAEFMDNLEPINALADRSPGFVWRLQSDEGDATSIRPFGDDLLVNLSVWEDVDALKRYVYRTEHLEFVKRRKDWFAPMKEPHLVMWWMPSGELPDVFEAKSRLEHLCANGPSAHAFTFARPFPAPR